MDMSDPRPTMLGERYQVLRRLGTGGMAIVYHARDLNLQREVAVKVLRQDLITDPAFRKKFLQEARSAANLIHPNIVTVYDFGQDAGTYFMVMEYVQGTDLKSLLRRRGSLLPDEAIEMMGQICSGVGYAHRAGLVHCDLKPQNILVSVDGRAKITDFGIARALASIHPEERSDIVWGSPQYFAPEQAAGGAPSPSSDVYALGVVLFEMLTGRLPFDTGDSRSLAELHQTATAPSPRIHNPSLPPALEQIVLKILSKEPSARYRTADQLGRVLSTLGQHAPASGWAAVPDHSPPAEPPGEAPTTALGPSPVDQVDWIAVLLGLLAFIAVGGLVPLWLWVYLSYSGLTP